MAEYIERSAGVSILRAKANMAVLMDAAPYFEKAAQMLEKLPAADVVPVVHGRWVDGKCSNCGVDIPTDDAHDAIFENECRFCYYCGATMDGCADNEA